MSEWEISGDLWNTHFIHLLIGKLIATWNVFASNSCIHVRLDSSRCNGVDGDLLVASVNRLSKSATGCSGKDAEGHYHAANEGINGSFRSRVDRMLRDTLYRCRIGARQDDAATDTQMSVCFSCDKELATSVDSKDSIEFLTLRSALTDLVWISPPLTSPDTSFI